MKSQKTELPWYRLDNAAKIFPHCCNDVINFLRSIVWFYCGYLWLIAMPDVPKPACFAILLPIYLLFFLFVPVDK
jgi:hypothetical protein